MVESAPDGGAIWTPDPIAIATSAIGRFATEAGARAGRSFVDYNDLWSWSVGDLAGF